MLRTESRHARFKTSTRPRSSARPLAAKLKIQAGILVAVVAVLWLLELADQLFLGRSLDRFGIQPRTAEGLPGILLAPFLHGSLGHVAANTVPFVVLGWLVMIRGLREFCIVALLTILGGGLGVWLIGQPGTVHVGASGLVFGFLGFLILRGYFDRGLISIGISLLVGLTYGGLIWGVLPIRQEESWEAHLTGFLVGVVCARLLARGRWQPASR